MIEVKKILEEIIAEHHIAEQDLPVLRPRGIVYLVLFALITLSGLLFCGLLEKNLGQIFGLLCFSIGAILWFTASIISTPLPLAYLSGVPENVIKRAKVQARCNAFGAASTAIGLVLQIYAA